MNSVFVTLKDTVRWNRARFQRGGVVFIGDVFAKGLTFILSILLLKAVTPEEYRLFGVFITLLATFTQLTDSGIHQSYVRFHALYRDSHPARARAYTVFSLTAKILLLVGTAVLMMVLADVIAGPLLHVPELVTVIRVLAIGVVGSGFFEFGQAHLLARQEFTILTGLRVGEAVVKLVSFIVFLAAGWFSLNAVYGIYIAAPFLFGLLSALFLRFEPARHVVRWRSLWPEFSRFARWLFVMSWIMMVLQRIDVFMVSNLMDDRAGESGLYMAAVRLCVPYLVLSGSVVTIFFPKAMSLTSVEGLNAYVRRSLGVTIPLVLLSLGYMAGVSFFVPAFLPNYRDAVPVFLVLSLGYVWTILGNPITMLLLSLNRTDIAAGIAFVQLVVTAVSHYILISAWGAMGAAISTLLVWLVFGGLTMVVVWKRRSTIESVLLESSPPSLSPDP